MTKAQRFFFARARDLRCTVYHDTPRRTGARNEHWYSRIKGANAHKLFYTAVAIFGQGRVRKYIAKWGLGKIPALSIRRDD